METKHTKGPWKYHYTSAAMARAKMPGTDGGGANGHIFSGSGLSSITVAYLPHHRDVSEDNAREANAKLIAAAPEMLEVLKKLEGFWLTSKDNIGGAADQMREEINAAIQKATL